MSNEDDKFVIVKDPRMQHSPACMASEADRWQCQTRGCPVLRETAQELVDPALPSTN